MKKPFEVWVGNLAEYTKGNLKGEWLELPLKNEDLKNVIKKISNNGKDEIMIMDHSVSDYCNFMREQISEWDDVYELNTIAKLIGEKTHPAIELFFYNSGDLSLLELANLLMQEEEIPYFTYEFEGSKTPGVMDNLSNEAKMGYTILERSEELKHLLENIQVGAANLGSYVDAEAIGRDMSFSGEVELGAYGYIDKHVEGPELNTYTMEEIEAELTEKEMKKTLVQKAVLKKPDIAPRI